MLCHECLMDGRESPPVALCEHCKVFLSEAHLRALCRAGARTVPFFTYDHDHGGAPIGEPPAKVPTDEGHRFKRRCKRPVEDPMRMRYPFNHD